MLTKRQKEVLDFIKNYTNKKGYAPSFEEIASHLGIVSVSTVHFHITRLRDLGYLKKSNNMPRAVEILEEPVMVSIPVKGLIAAGEPIQVFEEHEEVVVIPKNRIRSIKEIYALRVEGQSMIDENINDGDFVIVKYQESADEGDKVVALINGSEATLKKLYYEKNQIRLQPANKEFSPIYVKPQNLAIQGKVIDIIKQLPRLNYNQPLPLKQFETKNRTEPLEKLKKVPLDEIICGDAIENLRRLPDQSIDLVIADPPYNLSKGNTINFNRGNLKGFGGEWNKVMQAWDNLPLGDYFKFTLEWLSEIKRVLKPTGSIWVFGTYHNIGIINFVFQILELEIINEVIWYKRNAFPNLAGRRLTASHETLLWGHAGAKRQYYFDYKFSKNYFNASDLLKIQGKQMRTVWDIPNNKESREIKFGKHPTQKPLSVCKRIIKLCSKPGDLILAPFAGAGTECLAAKELKRHYIGLELENEYVQIANRRLKEAIINQTLF